MKKILSILIVFIYACLIATNGYSGWTGPTEVLSEAWGSAENQLGFKPEDTADSFPEGFWLLGSKIVIRDQENRRMKIYDINGEREKIVNWIKQPNGSYKIPEYPLAGESVGYVGDNLFTYYSPMKDYGAYSPTGQLIKTSTTRPLELGKVTSIGVGAGQYRTTAEFPDVTYQFIDTQPTVKFYRDLKRNFFRIETFTATVGEEAVTAYKVHKYDACSKKIGLLDMPRSTYEPMPAEAADMPTWKPAPVMEYGEPLVAPNGDVYTWKRTPDKYSILKWTWKDDPNVPTGPDAPTGLSVAASINGLYLTWTVSPNDPGCVTGYEIARATSSGGVFSTVATTDKGVVKYNDTSAAAGKTYYYKVRAKAGTEYSPYTSAVSGKR